MPCEAFLHRLHTRRPGNLLSAARIAQSKPPALRDGSHDFDFEFGEWKTHLRRLTQPLSNSDKWVEYDGTTKVTPVWGGRANLIELDAEGPAGHITALNLRLYNPASHQWSLNFSNVRSGTMGTPTVGEFKNGIGEFYDQEDFDGRAILVRFTITPISADEIKFEQSFSADGGKTWELNWVATDTRSKTACRAGCLPTTTPSSNPDATLGSHSTVTPPANTSAPQSAAAAPPTSKIACRAGCLPATANPPTSTTDHVPQTNESPPPKPQPQLSTQRQSLDNAWWTGPLLANSPATLPRGHFLAEPYLYDVIGAQGNSNGFGSRSYLEYGLFDRLTIGAIPVFGYNAVNGSLNSSHVGVGDWTVLGQYGLTRWRPDSWVPTTGIMVEETFPTGKYDNLGTRPTNGLGAGAYTTTIAFNSQTYFWAPNGRILRMRLDASEAISTTAPVNGVSVYGTGATFRGRAKPGLTTYVDWAWEYSLKRSWVLALDTTYSHTGNTRVTGFDAATGSGATTPITLNSGTVDAVGFAPAIEYSWKSTIGVILGARILAIGHNLPTTVTPAIAINYVR